MKRIAPLTLCLLLALVCALPGFSQGGENAAWQAIEDQRDTRRQAELLESFIRSYSNSPHRPDADKMLLLFWTSNKDNAKIVNHVDTFKQSLPSADNASKSEIYTQGMVAAATLNNVKKTVEFGEQALVADPKNFMVLSFLASSGVIEGKTALDYARRASELPRPAKMADSQYQSMMTRVKNLLASANAPAAGGTSLVGSAQALLQQKKYKEALEIYGQVLQQTPKDQSVHYQVAVANYYMLSDAVQIVQTANDEQIKAMLAKPLVQADVDKAAARKDEFTKLTMAHRDAAIESLAKAVAIGGPITPDAQKMLDALYTNRKGSLEGLPELIAEKKKELGVTDAPAAPAPAAPRR
jgi:tetratricopeptide (TPR) repeat protein